MAHASVWRRFERNLKDGTRAEFVIQTLTDEYVEPVVDLVIEGFMKDEPISVYLELEKDPESVEEVRKYYRYMFSQNVGLLCLTKDSQQRNQIVGFNATAIAHKDDEKYKSKSKAAQEFIDIEINYVPGVGEIFDELNVSAYMYEVGLYVLPEYRGLGIGLEILVAREPLCKSLGIKLTGTMFTTEASKKIARKAGYKDFVATKACSIRNDFKEGSQEYNLSKIAESCQYMYIVYE